MTDINYGSRGGSRRWSGTPVPSGNIKFLNLVKNVTCIKNKYRKITKCIIELRQTKLPLPGKSAIYLRISILNIVKKKACYKMGINLTGKKYAKLIVEIFR